MIDVQVEICREGVQLPVYAREGDAGMDVRAAVDITVAPGATVIVPTGLKVAIPAGYEIQVRPRSGMSYKTPLRVPNAPGTIDSGYRDELGVLIWNSSPDTAYEIKAGDRIAQLVLQKVPIMHFIPVENISAIGTSRGGGFGSTGKE